MAKKEISDTILVVDDEVAITNILNEILINKQYKVKTANSAEIAIDMMKKFTFDLVVADLVLPGVNGLQLLHHIQQQYPETVVIIISAYGTLNHTADAIRMGAYDYIAKPFNKFDFIITVENALKHKKLIQQAKATTKTKIKQGDDDIVYADPSMAEIIRLAEKIAKSDASSILINGPTGAGKEVIARYIHRQSFRAKKPFMEINCAAIPEPLLENELFGHEKGAFTDAASKKIGLLEVADGGTVFLDEIGELPLTLQPKLLRSVEDKSFMRVGGTKKITTDVRIIAATNRNLEDYASKGLFRRDLFYRLNVINIYIPPLIERKEDIMCLANHFRAKYNALFTKNVKTFSKKIENVFMNYPWSGNVREMKNLMERLILLADEDYISIRNLPLEMIDNAKTQNKEANINKNDDNPSMDTRTALISLRELELQHIEYVLKEVKYNKTKAAKILGINRKTLWEKCNRYGISV